jgi:signal transduction histidine kinase
MAPIFDQAVSLLSTPEGFLIYSLVLGLCTFAALVSCIYAEGNQNSAVGKKMQLGLMLLFIAQLVLLISAVLGWLGVNNGRSFLPPLDSSLALFSLVLIIWLWAYPENHNRADVVATIIAGLIVVFGLFSIVMWTQQGSDVFYNATFMAALAYYIGIILLIGGIVLQISRRPAYWGFGLAMLIIMLVGYASQIFAGGSESDYAVYVHLAEMIAFIFLLALPQRLADIRQVTVPEKTIATFTTPLERQFIQSIAELFTETSPQGYYQDLARIVAFSMNADTCLLLMPPKTGEQLLVPVGYNRLYDKQVEGLASDGQKLPSIAEAIRTGKVLFLSGGAGTELQVLTDALRLPQALHFMMVPFHPKGTTMIMGMAVLTQSADVVWKEADARRITETSQQLVSMAGQYTKGGNQQADQVEMTKKLQQSQAQTDEIKLEYAQLKARYDSVSAVGGVSAPLAVEMAVMVENQKNLQDTISQLEKRNQDLERLLARGRPSVEEVEQLRQELRSALVDLARMPSTLSKSDQKMLEMQLSTVKHFDDMQPIELVNSIAQEFRQPLSSIIGYTDLLLGESVGLLGAVQRKFVERVKASAERLGILLNELVQIMSIDGGKVDQTQVSVDLKPVIDEAVATVAAQISEKNITLRVELPDNPPAVLVNKDALLQIIENLIENAYIITPTDGQIRLLARIEPQENLQRFMHISVSDQGGGVERTDISRVFLRRYKMENPHIKGIGDMGVGLSIVKSLVELNKGRVWVDSKEGIGSIFSVLLPLVEDDLSQDNPTNSTGT